ncbi:hypothetical protein TRFO_34630 [Tritrichomonas foetus]|uniref:Uncharacterized protein n=1 Tax=Tritrichomonas foetus TaxID=1144522 RepID=A0A1J4JIG6_9EUKA|nr:hypothetical protein TRFO_34630 [Tritrichomonas foetus]|eukprot:OHS98984.1 hypothetical protein TRFO_34630 [Tritrichomonas foetus]
MNEIDELVFSLTERLQDTAKNKHRNSYKELRNVYVEKQSGAKNDEKFQSSFKEFFRKLICEAGCDDPQAYYQHFNRCLNKALNNNDFENIKSSTFMDNLSPQQNILEISQLFKETLIENIMMKKKIEELKQIKESLIQEQEFILAKTSKYYDETIKNKEQEKCIKRGEAIRGDLYLLVDDMNRDIRRYNDNT